MEKEANKITIGHLIVTVAGIALLATLFLNSDIDTTIKSVESSNIATIEKAVISEDGIVLPVKWNDLGKQMVES